MERIHMLLDGSGETKGHVTQCHIVALLPSRKEGWVSREVSIILSLSSIIDVFSDFMSINLLLRWSRCGREWDGRNRKDRSSRLLVSTISETPESLSHQEGMHGLRPVAVVLTVKDGDK
jgi:hypothetical protein